MRRGAPGAGASARGGAPPARKLTIRPFAKRPSLPPDFFAGAWSRLEAAIDAAHASRPVDDAFETLYRLVQDACLHGRAAELRVKLAAKLAECVRSRVDRTLRRGACPGDPALFVERFERCWEEHCDATATVRSVFLYLDRSPDAVFEATTTNRHATSSSAAAESEPGPPRSIWDLGVALFRAELERDASRDDDGGAARRIPTSPGEKKSKKKSLAPLLDKTSRGFLACVAKERAGEPPAASRATLRRVSRALSAMGAYRDVLEAPLVESSRAFYSAEGERSLSLWEAASSSNAAESARAGAFDGPAAYLRHCETRLREERARGEQCLEPSTSERLRRCVEAELVAKHAERVLASDAGFDAMAEADGFFRRGGQGGGQGGEGARASSRGTLRSALRLARAVGKTEALRDAFAAHLKRRGDRIVKDEEGDKDMVANVMALKRDADAMVRNWARGQEERGASSGEEIFSGGKDSAAARESGGASTSPGGGGAERDANANARGVSGAASSADDSANDRANGVGMFADALKESFASFVNARGGRFAELVAKTIDAELRSRPGGRADVVGPPVDEPLGPDTLSASFVPTTNASGGVLSAKLDGVLALFRYIDGKDVFEAFYKKDLAKRLLLGKSASTDAEKAVIARLKAECGSQFTTKLEGMFKDVDLSRDVMRGFDAEMRREGSEIAATAANARGANGSFSGASGSSSPPPELRVTVLTAGYWPTYPPSELNLPREFDAYQRAFAEYYGTKHGGRRLAWQNALGHCVLRRAFPKCGAKELVVSTFQAAVLMLFNDDGVDRLTFAEIRDALGMEEKELRRTLQSLACGKVRVLSKEPRGREVGDEDAFEVNDAHFDEKLFRVKVNAIQQRETKEENEKTNERVFQDRQHQIDAAIVRVMKTRKSLAHQLLVGEILKNLRKFHAKPADLKKRIESLIEREYLERDRANPQVYNYLA